MAGLTRYRVTDRASGTVLAEVDVDRTGERPPDHADPARRTLVLPLVAAPADDPRADAPQSVEVVIDGWRFELEVEDAARAELRARATRARDAAAHDGPTEVHAIIPGRVVSVAVNPGDAVTAGGRLLAVEAMKMENEVRAPRDGVVERVAVGPGETVELGDLLVVIR